MLGWFAIALAAALLALHLQATTLIAAAALGVWCAALAGLWWLGQDRRTRTLSAMGACVGGACAVLAFWLGGGLASVTEVYNRPRLWSAQNAADFTFYHRMLVNWYAPLWLVLPVWAALGWRHRAVVGYCVVFALVPIGLHSMMAVKADRYILYALPIVFIITGVGVGELLVFVWRFTVERIAPASSPTMRRPVIGVALVLTLAAFTAYAWHRTPGGSRAISMLAGDVQRSPFLRSDWSAAQPALQPLADRAAVVVSSAGLKSLYHLGRLDVALSEQGARLEATTDRRPTMISDVISGPDALRALRDTHPSGLVVVEDEHWRQPAFVTDATADWLETELTAVPTEPAWRLRVYAWGLADGGSMDDKPS